jgi:hypothetical protein
LAFCHTAGYPAGEEDEFSEVDLSEADKQILKSIMKIRTKKLRHKAFMRLAETDMASFWRLVAVFAPEMVRAAGERLAIERGSLMPTSRP